MTRTHRERISRLAFLGTLAGAAFALAGCGGGPVGHGDGSSPDANTRAAVRSAQNRALGAVGQSGVANASLAAFRFGVTGSGLGLWGGGGGAANAGGAGVSAEATPANAPLTGAYLLNQFAAARPGATRAARPAFARLLARTREDGSGSGGGSGGSRGGDFPTDPNPFYFDEYLGLWVQVQNEANRSLSLLYEDEARTRSAGRIESRFPADWEVYPQEYVSEYRYDAGALEGTNGRYVTVVQEDGSAVSSYESTWTDGTRERGSSEFAASGASSWSHRSDGPGGAFFTYSGAFQADGGGRMTSEGSDGFASDYVYNTDGTGSGALRGPLPGLPARLSWTAEGRITVRYADGTVEVIEPGWVEPDGGNGSAGDGDDAVSTDKL